LRQSLVMLSQEQPFQAMLMSEKHPFRALNCHPFREKMPHPL
jgi:hypothetical protein